LVIPIISKKTKWFGRWTVISSNRFFLERGIYINVGEILNSDPIVGDGNCLFRAISFSLFGHEDNHLQLRNMAVETLRGNIDIFRDYFIDGLVTAEEQIDHLVNQVLMQDRNSFLKRQFPSPTIGLRCKPKVAKYLFCCSYSSSSISYCCRILEKSVLQYKRNNHTLSQNIKIIRARSGIHSCTSYGFE
jgi:hypothetical protein